MVASVSASEAWRAWVPVYDDSPNPLLALESRVLRPRLGSWAGLRVTDIATGTGRWIRYASSQGAIVRGVDLSPEMIAAAAQHSELRGRLAVCDARALPLESGSADLAICSFALGYFPSLDPVFREIARVARRIVVSDLHPKALAAGWTRSFRVGEQRFTIENYTHSLDDIVRAASAAGLEPEWQIEAHFGDSERTIFEAAGKSAAFDGVAGVPAIAASCWRHR